MVSLGEWCTSGWGPHSTPRVSPEPTASSPRSEESTGTHTRPLRVCEPWEACLRSEGQTETLSAGLRGAGAWLAPLLWPSFIFYRLTFYSSW